MLKSLRMVRKRFATTDLDGNYWHHNVEGDAVEGPVVCVHREEWLQALSEMKTGTSPHLQKFH